MEFSGDPTSEDVLNAAVQLRSVAVRTPLLNSPELDARAGGHILLKAECLQRTGAFKFRGAFNCLSRLNKAAHPGGVVTYSSGNHGQAIATVARMLGISATILMPTDAPEVKISKARNQGARIELYDRSGDDREGMALQIARSSGAAIVPPCDDRFVIAGQGTAALEAFSQADRQIDSILVPCGGGGLTAGTCLAVAARGVQTEIWPVEPSKFDDTGRSLAAGRPVSNPSAAGSVCDSLLSRNPHPLSFSIIRQHVSGALSVSDNEALEAMRVAFEEFRLVLEPGGAVALAAALNAPDMLRDRTTLVIASGGNVDAATFGRALNGWGLIPPSQL